MDLSVALLHENMHDKQGKIVTASLTLIDIHDLARGSRTFGITSLFVAHPSPAIRKLAHTLETHWEEGFGATYNPNRKEALETLEIVSDLDEVIHKIDLRTKKLPKLIASSAKKGADRMTYPKMREVIDATSDPFVLML